MTGRVHNERTGHRECISDDFVQGAGRYQAHGFPAVVTNVDSRNDSKA